MKLKRGRGRRLGGEPPRRKGRWAGPATRNEPTTPYGMLAVLAVSLFLVGTVAGLGWGFDRQLRGGILRQRMEAQRRPDWVSLKTLPSYVPQAFLAVVEPAQLKEGALRPPVDGTTVAGTLVRQVHRLPDSLLGDAQMRLMGPVLEKRLPQDALVELYLNRAFLGRQHGYPVYGIHHAAQEYFNKPAQQLTLGETATLAGLLLPPRIDEPRQRIGAVGTRRLEVLRVMRLGELITDEQYRQAAAEPLGIQPGLDQLPMSRPADWGSPPAPIRLPPNRRPTPADSVQAPAR